MQAQLIAHNVGFDRPRLTHSQFVAYLYESASHWNAIPNGQDQALRVQRMAVAFEKMKPSKCPVCSAVARKQPQATDREGRMPQ